MTETSQPAASLAFSPLPPPPTRTYATYKTCDATSRCITEAVGVIPFVLLYQNSDNDDY